MTPLAGACILPKEDNQKRQDAELHVIRSQEDFLKSPSGPQSQNIKKVLMIGKLSPFFQPIICHYLYNYSKMIIVLWDEILICNMKYFLAIYLKYVYIYI